MGGPIVSRQFQVDLMTEEVDCVFKNNLSCCTQTCTCLILLDRHHMFAHLTCQRCAECCLPDLRGLCGPSPARAAQWIEISAPDVMICSFCGNALRARKCQQRCHTSKISSRRTRGVERGIWTMELNPISCRNLLVLATGCRRQVSPCVCLCC